MKNLINDLINKFKYSEAVEKENLVFYPIFMDANPDQADYLLLDEAIAGGILEVSEVSDAGSVNVIVITNTAEKSVLVFDGDELIGAKQNRMVNTTIIIPGKSRINIPVSCVERGRWHRKSKNFRSSDVFGYCELRKQKAEQVAENLAFGSSFSANQSKIWSEIDRKQAKMGSFSGTDALHDVYKEKRHTMEEYINGIKPVKGQVGLTGSLPPAGMEQDRQEMSGQLGAKEPEQNIKSSKPDTGSLPADVDIKEYRCSKCNDLFAEADMVMYKLNTKEGVCHACLYGRK